MRVETDQEMILSEINVYPIKSLKGISLAEATVEQRGLRYDRRWMLVGEDNKFITQREYPRMAVISVSLEADGLRVSARGMEDLLVPFRASSHTLVRARVWRSICEARLVGEFADVWFSEFLGTSCRLVYMPDETRRRVNPSFDVNDSIVSFADGYPFKLIGQASLEDLNRRLETPVQMNRFRPNFVIYGSQAFAEDRWKRISLGPTVFHVVKACDRCSITTINQETGEVSGNEPLKTLAAYRLTDHKILFGQYLLPDGNGTLRVGDRLRVLELKD